jgi:hypothetical protein
MRCPILLEFSRHPRTSLPLGTASYTIPNSWPSFFEYYIEYVLKLTTD